MTKNNINPNIHNKYKLFGTNYGDRFFTQIKKMPYVIDVFKSFHTVPCMSYGFSEIRTKLKPELKEIPQNELEKLKLSGIEITNTIEVPQFCYIGDTDERVFTNPIVQKFPTVIVECTFLYDEHVKNAKKDKHMHWTKLKPFIESNPSTTFILIHFSSRYSDEDIIEFFKDKKLDNMIIWC
jgi:ribonuclease Z